MRIAAPLGLLTLMSDQSAEELSLPKATVQKIIQEILPPDLAFSRESRDALIECCVMFIMILSTESNDIAERESKKTIASEHVIKALQQLGFPDYVEPVQKVISDHKDSLKQRDRKVGKLEQSGRSEEELLREQEELFRSSRQRMLSLGGDGNSEEGVEIQAKDEDAPMEKPKEEQA